MSTVITREQGYTGFSPEIVRIVTTSTLTQVTTAGWYNNSPIAGESLSGVDLVLICYAYASSSQATALFSVSISSTGVVTLSIAEADIVLPTIANHIATYTNTSGTLSEDPATAISGGNIQAGLSGTSGTLASFPATPLKGSLILAAVANTGNTTTTFSNVAMGQASVISAPDPANAIGRFLVGATATPFVSGNFPQNSGTGGLMIDSGIAVSSLATTSTAVLLAPAGNQTITAHNLTVSQGNLQAGSSGHAGTLTSFPASASNGSFIFAAVGNAGNFSATLSPVSTLGQASVYTLPDPATATANVAVAPSALVSGNVVKASGTAGLIVDAGFALHSGTTSAYAGGGTSNAFTTTNMTSASIVTATILSQTNAATIVKAVPGTNTLTVTFSADPGANTTINWISVTAVA